MVQKRSLRVLFPNKPNLSWRATDLPQFLQMIWFPLYIKIQKSISFHYKRYAIWQRAADRKRYYEMDGWNLALQITE